MVIVGDTTMAEIKPKLEALFKDWKKGTTPTKKLSTIGGKDKTTIYILDKPGAAQSVILAGQLVAPTANPDEIPFKTMTQVLGGSFVARINMNLREDKHWSYGSYTFVPDARGQRPFIGYAPVQTDKTKEALVEVMKEFKGIVGAKPVTGPELTMAQDGLTRTMPGEGDSASGRQLDRQMVRSASRRLLRDLPGEDPRAEIRRPRHGRQEDAGAGQDGLGRRRRPGQDRSRHQGTGLGRREVPRPRRQPDLGDTPLFLLESKATRRV
jgi:predicted Zn-dependent peptidase